MYSFIEITHYCPDIFRKFDGKSLSSQLSQVGQSNDVPRAVHMTNIQIATTYLHTASVQLI